MHQKSSAPALVAALTLSVKGGLVAGFENQSSENVYVVNNEQRPQLSLLEALDLRLD